MRLSISTYRGSSNERTRMEAGGKAIAGIIREFDSFLLCLELSYRKHRTEDLVLDLVREDESNA